MTIPNIQAPIEQALAIPALKHAITGVLIRSLTDGATLFERHADLSLVPASNLKLLTAFVALSLLGSDYRYKTTLYLGGEVDADGTLHGDLFLRGSGDPSLTSGRLLEMVRELRSSGIKRIDGRIVGDGTAFDDTFLGAAWEWDDEPYYYSAQLSGLNCDRNVIRFHVLPSDAVGDPAKVLLGGDDAQRLAFKGTSYVKVKNTAVTTAGTVAADGTEKAAEEPKIEYTRARAANTFLISGSTPVGASAFSRRLTIEDPALFTATRFAELCALEGILTRPIAQCVTTGPTPAEATAVVTSESAPLSELLLPFLKDSDNLFGEAFLKTLGSGSASAGTAAVTACLESCGLDTSGLHMFDGSGLSRMNTLPPRLLIDLLIYVESKLDPKLRAVFVDALPIAGVDGTLDDRMKDTPAEGSVWAKTGSLDNASAMSGYLETIAKERLVFAIVMNNFAEEDMRIARVAQETICLALMDLPTRN